MNYSRDEANANEVVDSLQRSGARAVAIRADIGEVPDIEHLFAAALNEFGRLDIVVANAGIELLIARRPTSPKPTSIGSLGLTRRAHFSPSSVPAQGNPSELG